MVVLRHQNYATQLLHKILPLANRRNEQSLGSGAESTPLLKPSTKPGLLAIIAYDQLRTFEYAIAAEVFALERPSLGVPWYECLIIPADAGPKRGIAGVRVQTTGVLADLARCNTIIIPGWRDIDERPPEPLLRQLRLAATRGATLLSICSGAFVLGAAGILDDRPATTHWLFSDALKRMYPSVIVAEDVMYVETGNIITSAGSAAGIDACLHLVRRDFGAQIANRIARRMVAAPHREGGQAQYVETPVKVAQERTPARAVAELLTWAGQHLDQPLAIPDLARRALMSQRTFLRHFQGSIGMTPGAWLQRERVSRARVLLEGTELTHAQIADQCGYQSLETFRIAFKRIVGVAPGGYRERFLAL